MREVNFISSPNALRSFILNFWCYTSLLHTTMNRFIWHRRFYRKSEVVASLMPRKVRFALKISPTSKQPWNSTIEVIKGTRQRCARHRHTSTIFEKIRLVISTFNFSQRFGSGGQAFRNIAFENLGNRPQAFRCVSHDKRQVVGSIDLRYILYDVHVCIHILFYMYVCSRYER